MTREPYTVASTDSLARVRQLMHESSIRHLPVVDGQHLVGLVAERDVATVESVPGVDLHHIEVARVMSHPLEVWGETPLDEVADLMSRNKSDCVIVKGGHGVAGIFTANDALWALSDLLRRATT